MMSGSQVEILAGDKLEQRGNVRPGDYLFIPAGVPHVAVNRSHETAVFMGARTDPNANESVVMLPELDILVDAALLPERTDQVGG